MAEQALAACTGFPDCGLWTSKVRVAKVEAVVMRSIQHSETGAVK